MKIWSIISSGVIAGLIAGLVLAMLVLSLATPLILQAEKYEHQDHTHHESAATQSETNQRNLGTIAGTSIISILYGLILALIYSLSTRKPVKRPIIRGAALGAIGYTVLALIPSLAFLPNLPGVEAKASATVRQNWWFLIIAVELIGTASYYAIFKYLKISNKFYKHVAGLISFALITAIPFLVGVPNSLEGSLVPDKLLLNFRLVSFSTLLVFWLALGTIIGWLFKPKAAH